jgi:hypothetical protein
MGRTAGAKDKSKRKPRGSGGDKPEKTEHAKAASKTDMTDDQLQALTAHHASAYKVALEAKKLHDANFKNCCKLAKAEGVTVDEIKLYLDIVTPEGQARVKAQVEMAARIARWRRATIGEQFKLFDDGDTNSFQAGKEAGLAGDPLKVPTGRDIEEFSRGWHEGQRIKISGIKTFQGERGAEDVETTAPGDELDDGAEGAEPDETEPPETEPAEPLAPGSEDPEGF